MKVSEVMTHRVISVSPQATIRDALELMLNNQISRLPVIDDKGKLVGFLSEGDFLRRPEIGTEHRRSPWFDAFFGPSESANRYVRSHGLRVHEVITPDPIAVGEDTPLDEVVHLMEAHRVKRLPVVRHGKVIGIVSRANLVRALASIHRTSPRSSKSNTAIRNRIPAEIGKQSWSAGAVVDVIVRDGIVDLWGTIFDVAQQKALKVLVENVPGVKQVSGSSQHVEKQPKSGDRVIVGRVQ